MKQRITYIVHNADDFNPNQLEIKAASIKLNKVKAAKEQRVTFGLSELPGELRKALEQWHELHIRWASERPYTAIPPFTSLMSPGLHVFFTPQKDVSEGPLCTLLQAFFGSDLRCEDPKKAFTQLPILSERFSMSATSQYYAYLPSLSYLVESIRNNICVSLPGKASCPLLAARLLSATYVDMDYDAISHALVINAFWNKPISAGGWNEHIELIGKDDAIEIGVLNHEPNPDPEDIAFSGFLTVLGEDTAPKPTRFQTPTRHYPMSSSLTYKASFSHPTGLHPTLVLSLPVKELKPPNSSCKLHAHLTFPSYLFIDKYQFSDPLFLSSHNLISLRSLSGATDLEAPDWVIPAWGSAALFQLAVPTSSELKFGIEGSDWNATIPVHLRYLPATDASHTSVPIPWPVLFWACRAEEGTKMAVNPFDRLHLGYEALFGPKTRFMHIPPEPTGNGTGALVEWIDVPVLDLRKTGWVEGGTVGVVVLAFAWLCWVLFGKGFGSGGAKKGVEKGKKMQ
ncbi:PIG-X-domain-containing protein [Amniculicola lignicola CBS 123094]|uniref:Protein PBN1 n=1 Tax=Amniculicola lignicola CBS 123094 TaxID=1392246 RepID=A0A6A5WTZ1_9PLEO|nr:PIG-X-domain-containing protein [Amniculicola lignicola CBS 123094]